MDNKNVCARSIFSRIGFALLSIAILTTLLQCLLIALPKYISPIGSLVGESDWYLWICTFFPLYGIGIPVGIRIMKKIPCEQRKPVTISRKNISIFILMSFPIMYGGSLIGTLLSLILSGETAANPLHIFIFTENPLKIVFLVILAPIVEEFLFRRQLIDRTVRFGEKSSIVFSAFSFALFHMNLYQFFYAFGLGLLFGYVYTRTRRLRYTALRLEHSD